MDMSTDWIAFALSHFELTMLLFALFFIVLHLIVRKKNVSFYEVVFRWVVLFSLGFTSLYVFIMQAFFPILTASSLGWQMSPFQFEVALANLSLGVLGVLSFRASLGFRLATVLSAVIMLWGDAIDHFTPGNAGSWFWLNLIIPLILLICFVKLKRR
jgi:hypothetical protein